VRFIINDHKAIFEECYAVCSRRISIKKSRKEVFDLLVDLDYVPDEEYLDTVVARNRDRNRTNLLALAGRLEKIFELPLPHAPGAKFVGGMVSANSNGVVNHGNARMGVGGRGVSLQQAFQSCIGEAAEYLSFIERDDDPLLCALPVEHNLSDEYLQWALSGGGISQHAAYEEFDWIEARSLSDNEPTWFPASLVLRQPARKRLAGQKSQSTGVSAGIDIKTACEMGLLEVIERDAVGLWWYGGRQARRIDQAFLVETGFMEFAHGIRGSSERKFWLLDITTDLGIPVVGAFSANSKGRVVVAGYASGIRLVDAMKRAFLEMCQMELAQEISLSKYERLEAKNLCEQDWKWVKLYKEFSIENYPALVGESLEPKANNPLQTLTMQSVIERLQIFGFQPSFVDLTRPEIGISVVKVLVPGLQSLDPKWLTPRLVQTANYNNTNLSLTVSNIAPI